MTKEMNISTIDDFINIIKDKIEITAPPAMKIDRTNDDWVYSHNCFGSKHRIDYPSGLNMSNVDLMVKRIEKFIGDDFKISNVSFDIINSAVLISAWK